MIRNTLNRKAFYVVKAQNCHYTNGYCDYADCADLFAIVGGEDDLEWLSQAVIDGRATLKFEDFRTTSRNDEMRRRIGF
jgi:hypothetical protein